MSFCKWLLCATCRSTSAFSTRAECSRRRASTSPTCPSRRTASSASLYTWFAFWGKWTCDLVVANSLFLRSNLNMLFLAGPRGGHAARDDSRVDYGCQQRDRRPPAYRYAPRAFCASGPREFHTSSRTSPACRCAQVRSGSSAGSGRCSSTRTPRRPSARSPWTWIGSTSTWWASRATRFTAPKVLFVIS